MDTQCDTSTPSYNLRRFKVTYLETRAKVVTDPSTRSSPINISLQTPIQRHIGTLIHETLQNIAETGSAKSKQWPLRLKQLGVPESELDVCLQTIQYAVDRTQKDPRGQWILSNKHQDAYSELPLTFFDNAQLKKVIIDRCFIDNETRWIIDYKTGRLNKIYIVVS